MILLALIIFLRSLIFLAKAIALNKWETYSVLNLLTKFKHAKSDISSLDSSVIHVDSELAMVGCNIKGIDANSHTVHFKIVLLRFINLQQSSQSIDL